MKKIIFPGLLAGLAMLLVSMASMPFWNAVFPTLQKEYMNPSVFRPWSDPLMSVMFLHPVVLGFILAWIWDNVHGAIKAKGYQKGLWFGFAFWMASSVPGMLISYSSFIISFAMIISWTLTGLVQVLCAGLIFNKLNK